MTLWAALSTLARRWYVVLAVLVASLGVAWHVLHLPVTYEVRSVLLYVAPVTRSNPNIYQSFGPGLVATAEVTSQAVNTSEVRQQLRAEGYTAEVQVALFNSGSEEQPVWDQPMVVVTAQSHDPALAMRTEDRMTQLLQEELTRRQRMAGGKPWAMIGTRFVGVPTARPLVGRPKLALVAIVLLGAGLAAAAGMLADRVRPRWRFPVPARRRTAAA